MDRNYEVGQRNRNAAKAVLVIWILTALLFSVLGKISTQKESRVQISHQDSYSVSAGFGTTERVEPSREPVLPSPSPTIDVLITLESFISSYGGLYSVDDLNYALQSCGSLEKTKWLVLLSLEETGMGLHSNFGYNWWSYNRFNWRPTTLRDGIDGMCNVLNSSSLYSQLFEDGVVNREAVKAFVNGPNSSNYPERYINELQLNYNKLW